MLTQMEFECPSWDQIYKMLLTIAEKISQDNFKPDTIVGVSRGGWPPGRIISDLLGVSEIANVKAEFYKGVAETKSKPIISQPVSVQVQGKILLIVDDVADTGESLSLVKRHLQEQGANVMRIVTIYYKPWSIITPDYYIKETKKWIVFPWERKETIKHLMEKFGGNRRLFEEAQKRLVKAGLDVKLIKRFIREIREEQKKAVGHKG